MKSPALLITSFVALLVVNGAHGSILQYQLGKTGNVGGNGRKLLHLSDIKCPYGNEKQSFSVALPSFNDVGLLGAFAGFPDNLGTGEGVTGGYEGAITDMDGNVIGENIETYLYFNRTNNFYARGGDSFVFYDDSNFIGSIETSFGTPFISPTDAVTGGTGAYACATGEVFFDLDIDDDELLIITFNICTCTGKGKSGKASSPKSAKAAN